METERPGAVYLAGTLAAHNSWSSFFWNLWKNVQDMGDPEIPADVKDRLLSFAKAENVCSINEEVSLSRHRFGKYGIAGSIINNDFSSPISAYEPIY